MKKRSDDGSQCAQYCMRSCICCFWLLEKFIRFLNHNAYTVIGELNTFLFTILMTRGSCTCKLILMIDIYLYICNSYWKHQFLSSCRCGKFNLYWYFYYTEIIQQLNTIYIQIHVFMCMIKFLDTLKFDLTHP